MPDKKLKTLIVDSEYLIALDLELMIAELLDCEIDVATPEAAREVAGKRQYDLALIERPEPDNSRGDLVHQLACAGTALVFTSTAEGDSAGLQEHPGWPVLLKPFAAAAVIAAVRQAIVRREGDLAGEST